MKNSNQFSSPDRKYSTNTNGSPVRKNHRRQSSDEREMCMAPMKANCVKNNNTDGVFDYEQPMAWSPPQKQKFSRQDEPTNSFSFDSP